MLAYPHLRVAVWLHAGQTHPLSVWLLRAVSLWARADSQLLGSLRDKKNMNIIVTVETCTPPAGGHTPGCG